MAVDTFWKGSELVCTATFRNAAGDLADPTAITFYTKGPGGATTPYVVGAAPQATRASPGVFQLVFVPDDYGKWEIVSRGQGIVTQVDRVRIQVEATGIATIDD